MDLSATLDYFVTISNDKWGWRLTCPYTQNNHRPLAFGCSLLRRSLSTSPGARSSPASDAPKMNLGLQPMTWICMNVQHNYFLSSWTHKLQHFATNNSNSPIHMHNVNNNILHLRTKGSPIREISLSKNGFLWNLSVSTTTDEVSAIIIN